MDHIHKKSNYLVEGIKSYRQSLVHWSKTTTRKMTLSLVNKYVSYDSQTQIFQYFVKKFL